MTPKALEEKVKLTEEYQGDGSVCIRGSIVFTCSHTLSAGLMMQQAIESGKRQVIAHVKEQVRRRISQDVFGTYRPEDLEATLKAMKDLLLHSPETPRFTLGRQLDFLIGLAKQYNAAA